MLPMVNDDIFHEMWYLWNQALHLCGGDQPVVTTGIQRHRHRDVTRVVDRGSALKNNIHVDMYRGNLMKDMHNRVPARQLYKALYTD